MVDRIFLVVIGFPYFFFMGFYMSEQPWMMKKRGFECTVVDYPPWYEHQPPVCQQWTLEDKK